jgi:hypothetical protein
MQPRQKPEVLAAPLKPYAVLLYSFAGWLVRDFDTLDEAITEYWRTLDQRAASHVYIVWVFEQNKEYARRWQPTTRTGDQ